MDADVILYSTVGPHVSTWDDTKPLGGTEKGLLVQKRAMEARGVTVLLEGPPQGIPVAKKCRALIINRWSGLPRWIDAKKRVHFVGDKEPTRMNAIPGAEQVYVSEWQRARGPAGRVIYPLLDDNVYALAELDLPKEKDRWIYASSFGKGLDVTLAAWRALRSKAHLVVTNTYSDRPPSALHGARWLGIKTPYQLAREIAISEGMFFYNTYEECFPLTIAIAKLMRCKAILGCVGHEPCGVQEAASVTLDKKLQTDQWMDVLGL